MTVPATARRAGPYNGNGSTTSFSFSFKTFATGDLLVTKMDALGVETTLVLSSDYSVSLNPDQDASPGGTITYPLSGSPLPTGSKLTIVGDLDYEQTTDLLGGGAFNARVIEDTFDRMVIQIQQLEERLDRALLVPVNSTANVQLPNPEANQLIGWNSGAAALQNYALSEIATAIAYGTSRYDTFVGNGSTTQFALTEDPAALANLDVSISGVTQVPGTDYSLTSATLVFTSAPPNGAVILARYGRALPVTGPVDASAVSFVQSGTGAVTRTAQDKMRETESVKDFGAVGDGVTDDTVAFTNARAATNGRYYIPDGTYLVAALPDVWADNFTASGAAYIKIGATTYNISNAFAGRLRYQIASNVLTNIVDAVTGNIVVGFQNSAPGTATYFYRGLAFKTDSHWCQVKPATNGGSTDLLWQRSDANADPNGNRFSETFEESLDRLVFSYATSASGLPNFDTYLLIVAGTAPEFVAPALPLMFNQGWKMQTRAGGALKLSYAPTSATVATFQDDTSGNVLQTTTRSRQTIAGIGLDTLLDTPNGVLGPQQWGGVFGDLVSGGALPIAKNLWSTAGATRNYVAGRMIIAAQTSGAGGSARIARFVFDGTTVTITDETNTLPVQVTATIALVSTNLQFQASYSGGLGGGCTISAFIEWSGAGR